MSHHLRLRFQPLKHKILGRFLAYGPDRLLAVLRTLGIQNGDTVMVHASWHPNNGFTGTPIRFIAELKAAVGPNGLLTMTSLPYHNQSSAEYLAQGRPMDVRRTLSRMGLLSEVFRRDPETQRSLSPTHPVLAWGREAADFLADHDKTRVPFGPESPFGRLLERNGKILLVDAPLAAITFTHYLEDSIKDQLPFPLYEPDPREGLVIDLTGEVLSVPTYVISKKATASRTEAAFWETMRLAKAIESRRVGNTFLSCISCWRMCDVLSQLLASGESLFKCAAGDSEASR